MFCARSALNNLVVAGVVGFVCKRTKFRSHTNKRFLIERLSLQPAGSPKAMEKVSLDKRAAEQKALAERLIV